MKGRSEARKEGEAYDTRMDDMYIINWRVTILVGITLEQPISKMDCTMKQTHQRRTEEPKNRRS